MDWSEPLRLFLGVVALLAGVAFARRLARRRNRGTAPRWGRGATPVASGPAGKSRAAPFASDATRDPGTADSGASDARD